MRVYWGTVDKLYCMMIDLYNINKKILEAPLPTCLIDYTHNNLIMHDIDDPSADPFTTCSTEENIYDRFSTIDEFSFNSTPSIFHLNDWLIE
jgi:hypothetical protein